MKITRIRIGLDRRQWKEVRSGVDIQSDGREVPWGILEAGPRPAGPPPPDDENNYDAEVIEEGGQFWYRAKGVTIKITAHDAHRVIGNPHLYYVTRALSLHYRILGKLAHGYDYGEG